MKFSGTHRTGRAHSTVEGSPFLFLQRGRTPRQLSGRVNGAGSSFFSHTRRPASQRPAFYSQEVMMKDVHTMKGADFAGYAARGSIVCAFAHGHAAEAVAAVSDYVATNSHSRLRFRRSVAEWWTREAGRVTKAHRGAVGSFPVTVAYVDNGRP